MVSALDHPPILGDDRTGSFRQSRPCRGRQPANRRSRRLGLPMMAACRPRP